VPVEGAVRVVRKLTNHGYNAEREAVTLLAGTEDTDRAIELAIEAAPADALKITEEHVRTALAGASADPTDGSPTGRTTEEESSTDATDRSPTGGTDEGGPARRSGTEAGTTATDDPTGGGPGSGGSNPPVSTGTTDGKSNDTGGSSPVETEGSSPVEGGAGPAGSVASRTRAGATETTDERNSTDGSRGDADGRSPTPPEVRNDVTDRSTGTGEYGEFVQVFRDRYERLSGQLRSRVNARPAESIREMTGGSETAMIGMVDDIRSTASGHWLVELEDTTGTFPCLIMKDREFSDVVDELLHDEVIAVEGTLSGDAGILFVDDVHFPEMPRNYRPSTADRAVEAALISDVHVGSREFRADAWKRFADWLHTPRAESVEYLLIAGDMVEGVGVYPDQDEELSIVDIYAQYERFAEHLKDVPGDLEIVMIPGNHDAVRLAEPQPGFDEELREIMSAHDARIVGNPAVVTLEGVDVLMYHGMSLDEVIAEFPEEKASYDDPHLAMNALLRKRHVAPKYGGKLRLAPEEKDYLVIDEVPDVFHTGHVHKLGVGSYRNVRTINSGCWQAQTAFQESVNIDPDVGYAPIIELDTLDVTVQKFT